MRVFFCLPALLLACSWTSAAEFSGTILDAETGAALPARVYVQAPDGDWLFVESAASDGSAVAYREQWVPMPNSVEKHTTVSPHPFRIDLAPGRYQLTIERGKEYVPHTEIVEVGSDRVQRTIRLQRWINMAAKGWYSGETHVHRRIEELGNVQLAEDLNVAFPVTFWTVDAFTAPGLEPSPLRRQGPSPFGPRVDRGADKITIDATHLLYPRNTEYEIFSVGPRRHVLGAIFVLNHKSVFAGGMPPVSSIAELAHSEGALLDLDKHSWPWSMMLVPIAKVDLFELSNNSVWRTKFGFRQSSTPPAPYMNVEMDAGGMTEWGWLDYGFQNYYALLNCGFRLQPTAGTASGVHPVPLGFSRVYVHLDGEFSGDAWLAGLRRGNSFVTTGPMLFATVNGKGPGHIFSQNEPSAAPFRVAGETRSDGPLDRIEVIVNGRIHATLPAGNERTDSAYVSNWDLKIPVRETSWIAVRVVQRLAHQRVRFAHSAPWHVEFRGQPIQPRRAELDYLIQRVQEEIDRNKEILPAAAISEYRRALQIYKEISERAR